MLLGVEGKGLGIDPKKILRPDPGLYSKYFQSYAIFCESQFSFHFFWGAKPGWELDVWKFMFHKKCHNSESIVSTDLGQVSKFSLSRYLKLFLWHQKAWKELKTLYKGCLKRRWVFLLSFLGSPKKCLQLLLGFLVSREKF